MTAAQLKLFTHQEEASLYLDSKRPGFFSILANHQNNVKRQRSYKLTDMPVVLSLLDASRDTWISQAEFMRPNRRVVNLWRVGLMFVDIDTYTIPDLRGLNPDRLASMVIFHCRDQGIPDPSLIIFSGRGLQAKWFLESPLPRAALPRWNAAQRVLVDRLSHMGADPAAKDASRVLRLVQTTNTRSGEICRVVHVAGDIDNPIRYDFDYLCEYLLPFTREQLQEMRQERAEQRERKKLRIVQGGRTAALRGFSGRQLAWHRLEDLRKLAELRGGVQEGERMQHLFWQLNFLLLSGATHSSQLWYEAQALARAIDPRWHHDKSALSTLYAKAQQYESGERVEFNGRRYPALYTPRNDTLINLFQITDDEQRKLRTIISPALARERDAERKRHSRGRMPRAEYLAQSKTAQKPWVALGMSRATWYRKGQPAACEQVALSTSG